MGDRSSPGFNITVVATQPVPRVRGRQDSRGKILDRAEDVTQRVTRFSFEDNDRKHDVLSLRVDNHDLKFFDDPVWVKGNLVRFEFGYPGTIFGPRYHVIDGVKGARELEIVALEEASLLNKAKCRLFKSKTRLQVVEEIVRGGSFLEVQNLDIERTKLRNEKPRDWQQAGITDWQFLQELAEGVNYEVYIEGDTLHFHPRRFDVEPRRRFDWFFGNGDLLDFQVTEMRTSDLPSRVMVAARDPVERKDAGAAGSDSDTERSSLGGQGFLELESGRVGRIAGERVLTSPDPDPASNKLLADTHYERASQEQVKMVAKIIGDPFLPAKSLVQIEGISKLLSGKYYVESHTHVMASGEGYVGMLKLVRNAVSEVPVQEAPTLDKSKAAENLKEVATDRRAVVITDPVTGRLRQQGIDERTR